MWSEIRNNYYDEDEETVYIDAWKTDMDDEEGEVIAKVNARTKTVEYLDENVKTDPYAQEIIRETINEYGIPERD